MANGSQGKLEKRRRTGTTICGSLGCNRKGQKEEKKNLTTASTPGFGLVTRPKPPRNKNVSWMNKSSNALTGTKQRESLWGKRQVVAEKGWQLSQSNNTKSQNLDADFKSPDGLGQRTWLGQRLDKDHWFLVSMQKKHQKTPSMFSNERAQG